MAFLFGHLCRMSDIANRSTGIVAEMGVKLHDCEGDMVCKSTNDMIPYFNAPIYLENKTQV